MSVAFVNYIQFLERATGSTVGPRFQNFFMGRNDFLPFGYGFGGGQTAGDRSQGGLVLAVNEISLNIMHEAMQQRYLVRAETALVDTETMTEGATLYQETWTLGSWRHNQVELTVELRGPGDAVRSGVERRINQKLVGNIPSSGQIVSI